MAGFTKAKAEQAALKIGLYGLSGTGKTFTSLLIGEGLAKLTKRRVAVVDTERGTDFYAQAVKSREIHPAAFDFDTLYTKSITETIEAVRGLKPEEYAVVIIDSITHLWESCKSAYQGRMTKIGTIPMQAWSQIKKPYKELVNILLNSPMHVLFCGRQGNVWEEDEETGELKKTGEKMKSEGETPYEPHILLHMMQRRKPDGSADVLAFAEKDRTGVLAGKTFVNPTFDSLCGSLLPLLGQKQAQMAGEDETANQDAEALEKADMERELNSQIARDELLADIMKAKTAEELKEIGKRITPGVKKTMTSQHLSELREKFLEKEKALK